MIKIATDGELISLMAHTIGSIGQIVKENSTLSDKYTKEEAFEEIKRIYNGYIEKIIKII